VQYVGTPGLISTNSQPTAPGGNSWYPDGGSNSYTDIKLTGGGTFSAIELLVGSGWFSDMAGTTTNLASREDNVEI